MRINENMRKAVEAQDARRAKEVEALKEVYANRSPENPYIYKGAVRAPWETADASDPGIEIDN